MNHDGDGEHVMVRIRKTGCNTRFVAEELAKFEKSPPACQLRRAERSPIRSPSSGFCLQMPEKKHRISRRCSAKLPVKSQRLTARNAKLRIGALKGNQFTYCAAPGSAIAPLTEQRLRQIAQSGCRIISVSSVSGRNGQNLHFALKRWADGEISAKDRSKRGFISPLPQVRCLTRWRTPV